MLHRYVEFFVRFFTRVLGPEGSKYNPNWGRFPFRGPRADRYASYHLGHYAAYITAVVPLVLIALLLE
jgi:hypothetical protein